MTRRTHQRIRSQQAHLHSKTKNVGGFTDTNTLGWSESLIPAPLKTQYTPTRLIFALSDGKPNHKCSRHRKEATRRPKTH
jgi:hypothetical protein